MPRPGQYREVLIPGLEKIGETELAKAMKMKSIMFAKSHSITGPVQIRNNITPVCVDAMNSVKGELGADKDELIVYYTNGLSSGEAVPVVNNCDEINAAIGNRVYSPGELFFTT